MKWLKLAGIVITLLMMLVAGTTAYLLFGDTRWLAAELARAAREQWQRTLTIDGGIELSLWPELGFRVGKARLSESGGDETFAAIESARLSIAPWPLLDRKIVVTSCAVEGLNLVLIRRRDGTLNIADLLPGKAPDQGRAPRPSWRIDIAGVGLTDARVGWRDQRSDMAVTLTMPTLTTGRIGGDQLAIDDIAGRLDIAHPKLPAKSLALPIGGRLAADFARSSAAGALSAQLDGSGIALNFEVARFAPLSLAFTLDIDHVDLDKYLARDGHDDAGRIDLAALKGLDIRGDIRIGRLRFGQVAASNITLAFDAAAGALELTPRAMSGDTARRDDGKRPARRAGH